MDSDKLTRWVRYLIFAQAAIAVISIISGQLEYRLLQDFQLGRFDSEAQATTAAEASDLRQQVVAILYILTFIIAGWTILRWIYRANQNARLLGAEGMTFTPGWSVGWYFVPVAYLWKPYQAMKEIWRASHRPGDWQTVPAGALVSWWWLFWIVSNILGQAIFRMSLRADDLDELIFANRLHLTSDVFDIGLNVVTLMLVNRIYGAQVTYFQAGQVVQPPALNPMEASARAVVVTQVEPSPS